jgi:DNA topoisomerase-1
MEAVLAELGWEIAEVRPLEEGPKNAIHVEIRPASPDPVPFKVVSVQARQKLKHPLPPFITSKLQQEAANRLRFTAKRTMMVAQQLYEGVELGDEGSVALITYMRTDSVRVSDDALAAVRGHIEATYGNDYLPEQPNVYKTKKSAQDAHEAIRPTSMEYPPSKVAKHLSSDQLKLYTLIWRWFVASQMVPAVYDQTTVDIAADKYTLRATGSILKFAGFLAAYGEEVVEDGTPKDEDMGAEAKEGVLPELAEQEKLDCKKVDPQQKFTQPPPRFSESSLVKELEVRGIGRPSTYATILSTIVTRGYVTKEEGRFYPTELGQLITELLVASFPRILDVEFTARMEEALDEVEEGKVDWHALLGDFYHGGFKDSLEKAKVEMRDVKREEIPTEHACHECGQAMVIKWGRHGSFLACTGYPQCRTTREYKRHLDGTIEILPEETTDELCPTCGGPMVVKRGRYGQFLACVAYPDCKGTRPMSIGVRCPENCGGYVVERRSKRGRVFFGCSNYPDCTFASWERPVTGPCPTCGKPYLVRKWTKRDGVVIRCPNKECDYKRDPELDDEDARAVSA